MKLMHVLLLAWLCSTFVAQAQRITTVAGSSPLGSTFIFSGMGGPATAAKLGGGSWGGPFGLVTDTLGNFYFFIYDSAAICKVNPEGIISLYAGIGSFPGYTGDGGPATAAKISYYSFCMDKRNNLYFTDPSYLVIRKIDAAGIITTIGGNTYIGFSGDGAAATAATLTSPKGICADKHGNVYFFDDSRIRKIDTQGIITTIAGDSVAAYTGDGGPATAAQVHFVTAMCADTADNLYLAEAGDGVIRKIDASGIITTVAGSGASGFSGDGGMATNATFYTPTWIFVTDAGEMYIADDGNNRIRKVNKAGIISTVAGNGDYGFGGDGGDPLAASLKTPRGCTLDKDGNLLIADANNFRIRKVTYTTEVYEVHDSALRCKVFPNPSEGIVHITFPTGLGDTAQVKVLNAAGTTVYEANHSTSGTANFTVTAANGIYTLQIVASSRTFTGQLLIQH